MNQYNIISENEIIKKYDFSSIIRTNDNIEIIDTVKSIIDSGNYFDEKNSPKYQTKENIFGRQLPSFLKLRLTFIMSCFFYLNKEVKIKGVNAWSFMTKKNDNPDRDNLWHHHHYDKSIKKLSGIYYVHIPHDKENYNISGTEFTLEDSPEKGNHFFVKPESFSWLIYPSHIWHRPGINNSDEYRYVVAADMGYID
jgi:hypothetical protein